MPGALLAFARHLAPMVTRARSSTRFRMATVLIGLLASITLGYAGALGGEFQFDDESSIVYNPSIKDLGRYLRSELPLQLFGEARPVTHLTFAVDYAFGGLDSRVFHLTNVGLHLVVVVLTLALTLAVLRRAGWTGGGWLALFVAGLFGLHPLATQAVSYVVQRAELLASLFYLAALLLLLATEERGATPGGILAYAASLLALLLGLESKLVAITMPAAYLLLLACAAPRGTTAPPRRSLARIALVVPHVMLAGFFAARTLGAFRGRPDVGFSIPDLPPGDYALTQLRAVLRYLALAVWPVGQNLDYEFPLSRSLVSPPATLLAALVLGGLAALAAVLLAWARRRGRDTEAGSAARVAAFGIGWFFLVLLPSSSVVALPDVIEEHRAYLATWGILLALAAAAALALKRALPGPSARWAALAMAGLVSGALGIALHERNQAWHSREALWADVAAKSPGKARAHFNLAHARSERGDQEGALAEYREAMAHARDGTVDWGDLARNMGASLLEARHLDEAATLLRVAAVIDPRNAQVENNLAIALLHKGDLGRAAEHARRSVALDPRDAPAHNTLGQVLFRRAEYGAALDEFSTAVGLDPDLLPALNNLAAAQEQLGRTAEACASWARYGRARGGVSEARAAERIQALSCVREAEGPAAR